MQKFLILLGVVIVVAGLAWPWLRQLPIGRLPGDFTLQIGGATIYLPLGSSVLISVIVTLLLRLMR